MPEPATSAVDVETVAPDVTPVEHPQEPMIDWKAESRKHEARAKKVAAELEQVRQQSMTEQEKAVAAAVEAARNEGRSEALRGAAVKVVDVEVRLAAAGRNVDVDALLEGLDRNRFIDDAGEADRAAITEWIDRLAPVSDTPKTFPDLGQGVRTVTSPHTSPGSAQLERDLKAALGIN